MTYIPGNWWSIDPITGGKFRISEFVQAPTKDNANTGDWVWKGAVDPVHPQEYVTGVEDNPSVPLSFPDNVQVVGETTLAYTTAQNSKIVVIPKGMSSENDPIGVLMNDGIVFWDFVKTHHSEAEPIWDVNGQLFYAADGLFLARSLSYDTIIISQDIWTAATAGNTVYLPAQNNEVWQ
jgi:hypothetical protein